MSPINLLIIFLGSGLGGVCRFVIGGLLQSGAGGSRFPWGTLAVNILGCFLIGLFYGLASTHSAFFTQRVSLLLTVGFCGGFTTFSTFINENYLLFNASALPLLLAYVAASVLGGFLFLYLGYALVKA